MPDGVRIVVDVWLPACASSDARVPTIVEFTRYWRATEGEALPPRTVAFTEFGFAHAMVDRRGSGASFGIRETEPSTTEVRDFPHVGLWLRTGPYLTLLYPDYVRRVTSLRGDWRERLCKALDRHGAAATRDEIDRDGHVTLSCLADIVDASHMLLTTSGRLVADGSPVAGARSDPA